MAVYTDVGDEELVAFVAAYDLGEVMSFKGIAEGVENTNYLLQTTTGSHILTLYEKRVQVGDLPYFLGFMEHLAARGVTCPTPLHGRDGAALRELCGRPAAIVTFLEGLWPRRIQPQHCAQVGAALARLHLAGTDFPLQRRNALSVADWRVLYESCAGRSHEIKGGLAQILGAELDHLEAHWPTDLPAGVCHADLFPDNVFFLGEKLSGMIDFYFACNDFFAYDLGICLNAWCFEHDGSFNVTKARIMLGHYRQVRPFSDAELQILPLMARGSAMRFLLTRLYDLLNHREGALVKPKDPLEFLAILQFHQQVRGPSAYGLE
ncbi:MAG: Homoserine kinase [Alphaproteobacteria bacterium MarineAlpha10_Bin3]|nr:MAG: Homoserine kinase [Alphaproteobacteria bacterium MarineAlpha10_Bin3]PPR71493.1 MAG: Homoserine kinase [Alphaproteobacteria bacterium MarineAlpha4_Bin1]